MYSVTADFLTKIKAPVRTVFSKVVVDFTDPFLDQSIVVAASENAAASVPAQTANSIVVPHGHIISLDGSWKLGDGSVLADITKEVGWWGTQLSDASSNFASPYPALTVTHSARPVHTLKVVGDSVRAEYPVDFTIKLYDVANTLLHTETVTGNALNTWTATVSEVGVVKQVLEITKWSAASRQVKIVEFFTSIQEIYYGDDIFAINLLEEREVANGSLPVGNISSNEVDLKLYNRSGVFDAGNTASPLYGAVKANRKIKPYMGAEVDRKWSYYTGKKWSEL